MSSIPQTSAIDCTLLLLFTGYTFITEQCRHLDTDIFQTRLLLEPTICMLGKEAAEIFYDTSRFERKGAAPRRLVKTLFGKGGVQGLDDAAHLNRKSMLMSLMTPERLSRLAQIADRKWAEAQLAWSRQGRIVLHSNANRLLCRAVCEWAGVPLPEKEVSLRTRQMEQLIEGGGAVFWKYLKARMARRQANAWAAGLIEQVRKGHLHPPENTALHTISWHRLPGGELLDLHAAAVDLLNIIRPTVAIGRFVTFAAIALYEHPEQGKALQQADENAVRRFVQEVRRHYPFFPFAAARVRQDFDWRGYRFSEGRRVLLDLYGTNHDERQWDQPMLFRPDRFCGWNGSPFNFIPQGGGDFVHNHRCAGEWATIEIMKVAVKRLLQMPYRVPVQDLSISLVNMPALPRSGFLLEME